jgi:predicted ester cyclase
MDHPIACSLSSADYAARRDEIAAIARTALRSRAPMADGSRLTFDASPDTEERLRTVIANEADCCSFLRFDLRKSGDTLELDVTGPADAEPIIAELFA